MNSTRFRVRVNLYTLSDEKKCGGMTIYAPPRGGGYILIKSYCSGDVQLDGVAFSRLD